MYAKVMKVPVEYHIPKKVLKELVKRAVVIKSPPPFTKQ